MASASQAKLERQVVRVAERALADRRFVTAIDVLVGIGWLATQLVEDWRRGRIPYLERVVGANLHKISTAMRYLRHWAEQRGLNPSETVYVSWTRDRHPLRFSKTGEPTIERAYRTHWVSPEFRESKRQRLVERQSKHSGSGTEAPA
jgi:hypothetical protein